MIHRFWEEVPAVLCSDQQGLQHLEQIHGLCPHRPGHQWVFADMHRIHKPQWVMWLNIKKTACSSGSSSLHARELNVACKHNQSSFFLPLSVSGIINLCWPSEDYAAAILELSKLHVANFCLFLPRSQEHDQQIYWHCKHLSAAPSVSHLNNGF